MKDLQTAGYRPVGQCIYCGAEHPLTREHIIAFGLGGVATLPKASCPTCAAITGEFERVVLRGPMWAMRVHRALQSRTKHADAPKEYPITLKIDGTAKEVMVPIEQYPILLHFPIFAMPGVVQPTHYSSGIRINGIQTVSFGPRPEVVAKQFGATEISVTQNPEPTAFARMIAKIAFCYAYAEGQLDQVADTAPVIQSILGKRDDIGKWVGTLAGPPLVRPGHLHSLAIHKSTDNRFLTVEVHLLSDSESPRYVAVLGELANAA